jgi:hypothetical protein
MQISRLATGDYPGSPLWVAAAAAAGSSRRKCVRSRVHRAVGSALPPVTATAWRLPRSQLGHFSREPHASTPAIIVRRRGWSDNRHNVCGLSWWLCVRTRVHRAYSCPRVELLHRHVGVCACVHARVSGLMEVIDLGSQSPSVFSPSLS